MNIFKLRNKITSSYFDYQGLSSALSQSGHVRRDIGKLIKDRHIIRVKKGLYLWGENLRKSPYCKNVISNLIYGPSYVSLEYAFFYYGLVPERVDVVTAVTAQRNKLYQTPVGVFEYCYLHKRAYSWGITRKFETEGESFLIATPEKALLDYIAIRVKKWKEAINIEEFLYQDLRFDENEFEKLNIEKIKVLSDYFKSRAVKEFVEALVISRGGHE